jgi:hypothetical protein
MAWSSGFDTPRKKPRHARTVFADTKPYLIDLQSEKVG